MLRQLIYTSQAIFPRGHLSDLDILREAIAHNEKNLVSGFLIRNSNQFLQALEGEPQAVSAIMTKICKDYRHSDITILSDISPPKRDFAAWSMGYTDGATPPLPTDWREKAREVLITRAHLAA